MAELLSTARRAPERLLHPWRRRAARAAARGNGAGGPRSILVVCYGNVCRSPFAAALLARALAPAGVRVESGGLMGPGRPSPPDAVRAAGLQGVDLAAHRSRVVTASLAREADLIVVMDTGQRRALRDRFGRGGADVLLLGDFDPEPIRLRAIHDPIDQPVGVYVEVYARIARCVRGLVTVLAGAAPRPPSRPGAAVRRAS